MAITITPISPVAFSIFGFDVRWYALAYIIGFVLGYFVFKNLVNDKNSGLKLTRKQFDDILTYVIIGVLLGGRLGYVLFYNFSYYMSNPGEILALWNGGMSFHGGILGVMFAMFIYSARLMRDKENLPVAGGNWWATSWKMLDLMTVVAPIGLFFGRIANFINMEVMGRATDSAFGVVFAGTDLYPRHPSPIYEALTEGLLLFVIMYALTKKTNLRNYPGALAGVAGMGYAVFRVVCEMFRAPDAHIGFLTSWGLTMGQLLSGLMFIGCGMLFFVAIRKKKI